MTQISRELAAHTLLQAGCPTTLVKTNLGFTMPLHWLMVGIGSAESDLVIEAYGPANADGSRDHGIWQINDRAWPNYDHERLRADALYNAQAAVKILLLQGLRAWYSYQLKDGSPGPYARKMPPGRGGADLSYELRSRGLMVKSWQTALNKSSITSPKLVVDGGYGPMTEAATVKWKKAFYPDGGNVAVNSGTWTRAGLE